MNKRTIMLEYLIILCISTVSMLIRNEFDDNAAFRVFIILMLVHIAFLTAAILAELRGDATNV